MIDVAALEYTRDKNTFDVSRDIAPFWNQFPDSPKCGSPTIPFGNARLRRRSGWWFSTPSAAIPGWVSTWLGQYYERLRAAGKPGKVAVIAAMRKLLTAVWSVATHRKPFVQHLPAGVWPTGRGYEQGLMNFSRRVCVLADRYAIRAPIDKRPTPPIC